MEFFKAKGLSFNSYFLLCGLCRAIPGSWISLLESKSLELLMNSELKKVKEWCDINKLSINLKKTNFMIIKPQRKKNMNISINITNRDGSCHSLERKDHIKVPMK